MYQQWIEKYPSAILRKKCERLDSPFEIRSFASYMIEMMYSNNGVGLAAPQVGSDLRLFVMIIDSQPIACYQPRIMRASKKHSNHLEECLSMPGVQVSVSRPRQIDVEFFDGLVDRKMKLSHLEARVFQHELDHLNGILITDYSFKGVRNADSTIRG